MHVMLNMSRTVLFWDFCFDDLFMVNLYWLQPCMSLYVHLPGSYVKRWRAHRGGVTPPSVQTHTLHHQPVTSRICPRPCTHTVFLNYTVAYKNGDFEKSGVRELHDSTLYLGCGGSHQITHATKGVGHTQIDAWEPDELCCSWRVLSTGWKYGASLYYFWLQ